MSRQQYLIPLTSIGLCIALVAGLLSAAENKPDKSTADKLFADGNYRAALASYDRLLTQKSLAKNTRAACIRQSVACLQQLNEVHQTDAYLEKLATQFSEDWKTLATVADQYSKIPHYGYLIAGEFRRGHHRGGGKVVNAIARDRVRSLQLYRRAYALLLKEKQPAAAQFSSLLSQTADAVTFNHARGHTSPLQTLTDLTELPDYEEGWGWHQGPPRGAPVDEQGNPVFYAVPESWDQAINDGQRWRWLLAESVRHSPDNLINTLRKRAHFSQSQFGVRTMASPAWRFDFNRAAPERNSETGTYQLHTLKENETIARLATGIKRFQLPDEHNHIQLYQQIINLSKPNTSGSNHWEIATSELGQIFEDRRQFPRAAEYWKQANNNQRVQQIIGNWGRFEPVMTQPAGQGATVDFRFRNGKRVEFTAHRIDVRKLLTDVKAYLKANPRKLAWERIQIENLGHRLVIQNQEQYLGEEVARWSLDLEPRENHFDRRVTVSTPLQEPGAYLLTSTVADGNTTSVVVWLNDTAIVKKPLSGQSLYYIADASTGQPIPKCNVEFFGFWNQHLGQNKYQVHTKNFAEFTDENGLVTLSSAENHQRHQWLAVATTPSGRFAYLGFRSIWTGSYADQEYQQVKVFTITDRPAYRPQQKVKFKFWVRHARYDLPNESQYASQSFQVEIRDPKNEKVHTTRLIADAYGGLAGEWEIPTGATLGQYRINVVNHGGGSFRVEEYKKPEFEVTIDAPEEPVQLGEKIKAKISAKYYFGSPVSSGTVKYKILRTPHQQSWFPPTPWDWLYGPGYWWFAADYRWYPGWERWGCWGPSPWWFWQAPTPPEVVAEQEIELGPDGTVEVEIDTSIAKELHPDQDHSYQIQAEVVDASRRTIVGNGRVLVARQPFKVNVWLDRGYYRVGDTIAVGAAARSLDDKPVRGNGILRLLKIQYKDAQPVETEVGRWDLAMKDTGQTELQVKAAEPGQYRLSYELTDEQQRTIEGGQVLTVTGNGFDSSEFRFNDLEIIPERRTYEPGEKVSLQINTNRTDATVLLFVRPSNGVYQPPQLVRLDGKSKLVDIEVTTKDMPNFFVEAVTVHGGKHHTVNREIFVPPSQRVLNVEVAPSAEAYLPGQAAKVLLKLTDENGEPFVGSLALSIYDKAVEYISGGSNVTGIREFFWKWRRNHRPRGESNIQRTGHTVAEQDKPTMQNLGVFGAEVLSESSFADGNRPGFAAQDSLRSRFQQEGQIFKQGLAPEMSREVAGEAANEADFAKDELSGGFQPKEPALLQPTVRQNFADTALWMGSLETNASGIAEVEFDMPENLTAWKVRAWGLGHGTRVGEGTAEVVTRKNLIVRLQAPRFFVERDEVVLSANVHNYLDQTKQVRVQLLLEGDTLTTTEQLEKVVDIEANGEHRVDWRVNVARHGEAIIRMSALTDEESDSMQMSFPVHVHGMLKTDSFTGVIRPEKSTGQFTVTVPEQRRPEQTRLEVRYTPTLAGAMVDALPYLIDYPYGCTEQTLNRFLPAVITQQTLRKMGIDLATIKAKRTNLNAQEIGNDAERSKDWKHDDRNPVFDEAELNKIVKAGVNRLTEMQLSDGGWGWFSGWGEHSSPHTTAVVMHGLHLAQDNSVAIVPGAYERGTQWLRKYQATQISKLENWSKEDAAGNRPEPYKQFADNLDALVNMVLAEIGYHNPKMREFLYRDRTRLSPYSLAMLGLSLHWVEEREELAMVMRNLSQYVRQDEENQTAWLDMPGNSWWYWYGSEHEAHAYYLKLLVAEDLNSPVARRLVKYLLNNRKHATYWNSTRDTALVVEAFADYLAATGEDDPDVTVEIWVDGKQHKQVNITRENLFTFDNQLVLAGDELTAGRHAVEIRKQGDSPIYFNGYLTNFTLEDDIQAAGLELKVERRFFKLTPAEKSVAVVGKRGQMVDQKVEKYNRQQLVNLAEVTSGDLIEVELVVDSKNDYEYILLEDMKAAGFEPVAIRSGYGNNELGAYLELRDDRVSLFVTRLARGRHSLSYRLRAEIPGKFSALPTRAAAMYAPELKANSDEIKLRVID